jgi:tetratricopeptide (TPR) repeat protein
MVKSIDDESLNNIDSGESEEIALTCLELLTSLINKTEYEPQLLYEIEGKLNAFYKITKNPYLKKFVNLALSHIAEVNNDNSGLLNLSVELLELEERIGDSNEIAQAHERIALIQKKFGNLTEAEEHRKTSLKLYLELGNKNRVADQIISIGNLCKEKGNIEKSLSYYKEALEICNSFDFLHSKIVVLTNMGDAYREIGQTQEAINALLEALQLCNKRAEEKASKIAVLRFLTWCYEDLNQLQEAIKCIKESYNLAIEERNGEEMAHLLAELGNICCRMMNFHEALNFNVQALDEYTKIGNLQGQADRLANIGRIYINLDNSIGIDFLEHALAINRNIGNRHEEALALYSIGQYYLHILDLDKALDYLTKSFNLLRSLSIHDVSFALLFNLGKVHEMLNNTELAWQMYEESLNELEFVRNHIIQEDLKIDYLGEDKMALYEHIILFLINKKKDTTRAFEYIERSKSRALIEQIGFTNVPIPSNISDDLIQREDDLINTIKDISIALRAVTRDENHYELSVKISTAKKDLEKILEEIKNAAPEYVSLRRGLPITFEELRHILYNA